MAADEEAGAALIAASAARDAASGAADAAADEAVANQQEPVRVYRVEARDSIPNKRVAIGDNGEVNIVGEGNLYLNFGNKSRAITYLARKLRQGFDTTIIKSFDVPKAYLDDLRSNAVRELTEGVGAVPGAPYRVDVRWADQFALPNEQLDTLVENIIQGSGRSGL